MERPRWNDQHNQDGHYEQNGRYYPHPPYPYSGSYDPYHPQHPLPPTPRYRSTYWQYWVMAIAAVTGIILLLDPGWVFSSVVVKKQNEDCQEVIQPQTTLSRETLAELLTVPERDSRERVSAILGEPYCVLPGMRVRAGTIAIREAYPLEFDPEMWLVILYEGGEYAGYDFIHR